jgi:DNA-binding response OmpR family regulator
VETVLIVEDDIETRWMFRSALSLAGYRVIEAGDGLDALRLLETQLPALVVLDIGLPLISGVVVRQELAAHAHTRDIPVVIVTGSSVPHEELGGACLLRKPVSPDELVATVRRCMASGASFDRN